MTYNQRLHSDPVAYSSAASQPYYTAVVLTEFNYEFPLGDGRTTRSGSTVYHNAPLTLGTYYYFVRYRSDPPNVSGRGLLPGRDRRCALY